MNEQQWLTCENFFIPEFCTPLSHFLGNQFFQPKNMRRASILLTGHALLHATETIQGNIAAFVKRAVIDAFRCAEYSTCPLTSNLFNWYLCGGNLINQTRRPFPETCLNEAVMNLAEIIVKNHSLCWHAIYQAQLAVVAHCDSQNRNVAREKEQFFQTQLVRDLFFNPFHPVPTIDPAWLEWRNGTVSQIANGIYQDEGLDQLPIVADALEEAGCTNALLINHLRSPGPHFRGCWALDLILGKQ